MKRRGRRTNDSTSAPATLGTLSLQVPGRHNLQNALAAVTVGLELGLPFDRIAGRYNLESRSHGREPNRRVQIFGR